MYKFVGRKCSAYTIMYGVNKQSWPILNLCHVVKTEQSG